jgi:Fe-S-cluster containining protein
MEDGIWYERGLKFSCLRCGKCCWDEGPYTEVYVNREDVLQMAAHLDLYPHTFHSKYVRWSEGFPVLKSRDGACIMLQGKGCRVYPVRPRQCRTWPFWAENLKRHVWYREVRKRCPGVGQGRRYTPQEIERIILSGSAIS